MSNKTDTKTYLKDYQEPNFFINETLLDVTLGDKHTDVVVTIEITSNTQNPSDTLVLDGENIEILAVELDGSVLSTNQYSVDIDNSEAGKSFGKLNIPNIGKSATVKITNRIKPQNNKACKGLYLADDMFCTQCEAEGFRNITYYLDRPDVMSVYTVTITGNKKTLPYMLSNGHKVSEQDNTDGTHTVTWHDPSLKPAYLFALVAGNLNRIEDTFVTMSGHTVDLHIFADKNVPKSEMVFAIKALQNSMRWDETRFDREYDLDLYMIVATGTFNMGAMENKALNIFNTSCVLGSEKTATDDRLQRIDDVIAHEYFHNWSGNIVTCRDWFQLSLKEGLTVFRDGQYNADHTSHLIKRIDDVKALRASQFAEDAGPTAHPIRPHFFETINNFYTRTIYEKGAEIIHMIYGMLGKEGFKKALNVYFKRHEGQAVTTEEFVKAMEDGGKLDLKRFRNWYDQGGTPLVEVETEYDAITHQYTIHLKQSVRQLEGYGKPKNFHLPIAIGLLDAKGDDMLKKKASNVFCDGTVVLDFMMKKQSFTFDNITEEPVLSFLRNFSAPVKVEMEQSNDDLLHLMKHDTDGYNRWEACDRLMTNELKRMITEAGKGKKPILDPVLIEVFSDILDVNNGIDNAMKTAMLSLPSEATLYGLYKTVDIDAIHTARKSAVEQLAIALTTEFLSTYQALSYDNVSDRELRNLCLSYLSNVSHNKHIVLAETQYHAFKGKNMTLEVAAFGCLVHADPCKERDSALQNYHEMWKDNADVIDTWFSAQAAQDTDDVLKTVQDLMVHPSFDNKNPNKLHALVGAFISNHVHFHKIDGSGYAFLADEIMRLNDFNPEVASRFMTPFAGISKYDKTRQSLIKTQIERIGNHSGLTKDVAEKVSSILASLKA
ncbi:MAG: aminopeptidase N [Alphaproteobacteria bacterium]|jgi:aminopeptidase N